MKHINPDVSVLQTKCRPGSLQPATAATLDMNVRDSLFMRRPLLLHGPKMRPAEPSQGLLAALKNLRTQAALI